MLNETKSERLHSTSPMIPLLDEHRARVSDLSLKLPSGGVNAQALAGLARMLRNTPDADGAWIDSHATLWIRVATKNAPDCIRNLAKLGAQFAQLPEVETSGDSDNVEFAIPGKRLSPRQLYALAALSRVEGAPLIVFSVDGSRAAFVGVPSGRCIALRHGLAEFGLTRT